MDFTDVSLVALRVFQEVAERGTLTAAAAALGYTQSAVSRQIATLERAAGAPLLERRRDGVRLTAAGRVVLRRAVVVLEQIDATGRELAGLPADAGTVRLGWFASAGGIVVPQAIAGLRRTHPGITVVSREASTPVLVRALRAGTLDVAVIASAPPFRPPDAESPPLEVRTLGERELRVAVPASHPLADREVVDVADLRGQRWIAGQSSGDDRLMGVWPGLDERSHVAHVARDWLAKLHLVAAGCGLTTLPSSLLPAVPPGVRALRVRDSGERRRILVAWPPRPLSDAAARLVDALRAAVSDV